MAERREKDFLCSKIYYEGGHCEVLETPDEINKKIEIAEDQVISRIQKAQLFVK